jgi:hypothetical protein
VAFTGRPSRLTPVAETSSVTRAGTGTGTARHTRALSVSYPAVVADCRRPRLRRAVPKAPSIDSRPCIDPNLAVPGRPASLSSSQWRPITPPQEPTPIGMPSTDPAPQDPWQDPRARRSSLVSPLDSANCVDAQAPHSATQAASNSFFISSIADFIRESSVSR